MDKEKEYIITSLIFLMSTPIAKRKGLYISSKDCEGWKKELAKLLE